MPTIDLSNNQATSTNANTPVPASTPAVNNVVTPPPVIPQPPIQQAPPVNNWNDPWGAPQAPWGGGAGDNSKRLSPQERVTMIENVFNEILNRKPDTRDINYYKYSTVSEEEIRKQLITGNEHKQLLQDGRDYKKLKDRTLQAETRVKILEGQIKDQVEEFRQLTNLLKEKNRYIEELREKLNKEKNESPFKQPITTLPFNTLDQNNTHFSSPKIETEKKVENKPISKGRDVLQRIAQVISDSF